MLDVLGPLLPSLQSEGLKACVSYLHELHQQAMAGSAPVLFAVARRFF